jgi:hypothetical protein
MADDVDETFVQDFKHLQILANELFKLQYLEIQGSPPILFPTTSTIRY